MDCQIMLLLTQIEGTGSKVIMKLCRVPHPGLSLFGHVVIMKQGPNAIHKL